MSQPRTNSDPYEVAVYSDIVEEITKDVMVVLSRHASEIPDRRVRIACIAAALASAAQLCDRSTLVVPGGVASTLMDVTAKWQRA